MEQHSSEGESTSPQKTRLMMLIEKRKKEILDQQAVPQRQNSPMKINFDEMDSKSSHRTDTPFGTQDHGSHDDFLNLPGQSSKHPLNSFFLDDSALSGDSVVIGRAGIDNSLITDLQTPDLKGSPVKGESLGQDDGKEISFIKKAPGEVSSFGGSWLSNDKLPESEKYRADQGPRIVGEQDLLAALKSPLFKDIQAEEYEDDHDKDLKQLAEATYKVAARVAFESNESSFDDRKEEGTAKKVQFDKISEKDEEDSEEEPPKISQEAANTSIQFPAPKRTDQVRYESLEDQEMLRLRNLGEDNERLVRQVNHQMKQPTLEIDIPGEHNSSMDSVDRLWQQALNEDNPGSEEEPSEAPPSERASESQSPEQLQRFKEEEAARNNQIMTSLISFNFPCTDPNFMRNIALQKYGEYLHPRHLNLAPSTDARLTFMMSQMGSSQDPTGLELFIQELGTVGFYGMQENEETLLSILLLTNYSDISEAEVDHEQRRRGAAFNNIQQYLVPDSQMSLLKRTLKKIVKTVTKDFGSQEEGDEEDPLGALIIEKVNFGVLLLLGKLYFHVCRFKQSLYCLNLALKKCKAAFKASESDLQQCLLWQALVHCLYLFNRIRVYKRNSPAAKQGVKDRTKLSETLYNACVDIFDNFRQAMEACDEYLKGKTLGSKKRLRCVVTYIKLKLEIFRQSSLFKEVVGVQIAQLQLSEKQQQAAAAAALQQSTIDLRQSTVSMSNDHRKRQGTLRGFFRRGKSRENSQSRRDSYQTVTVQSSTPSIPASRNMSIASEDEEFQRASMLQGPAGGGLTASMLDPSAHQTHNKLVQRLNKLQEERDPSLMTSQALIQSQGEALMKSEKVRQTLIGNSKRDQSRRTKLKSEVFNFTNSTSDDHDLAISELVTKIMEMDSYIGKVAQSEQIFWKMLDRSSPFLQLPDESISMSPSDFFMGDSKPPKEERLDFKLLQQGITVLEELVVEYPNKILASVKLWQFYRTRGQLTGNDRVEEKEEFFEQAFRILEQLEFTYAQTHTSKSPPEIPLIIAIMNAKSLFGFYQFKSCFELLQREYLRNSQYTGLLYLYGKWIVKANDDKYFKLCTDQKKFLGSGIGALEECLKQSLPEYHSRVHYYIGLAYNKQGGVLKMPLKSIGFWERAKQLGFNQPFQGQQKERQIQKFLDKYQFVHLIIDMIRKNFDDQKRLSPEEKTQAEQYLNVLSSFQSKLDEPSCLLLKSHIYAYTLKQEEAAIKCFQEVIDKHPVVIQSYLDFWTYLNQLYKAKKHAKRPEGLTAQQLHLLQLKEQKELNALLNKLKSITQKAIVHSNSSHQVSTSEWARVRIMAAKTYLLEKKVLKAIHILTDLCFVLPPDKLNIGEDTSHIQALYDFGFDHEKSDLGGIRFCRQVLAEQGDDMSEQENLMYSPSPAPVEFKNRIIIQKDREKKMVEDFYQRSGDNIQRQIDSIRDKDYDLYQSVLNPNEGDGFDLQAQQLRQSERVSSVRPKYVNQKQKQSLAEDMQSVWDMSDFNDAYELTSKVDPSLRDSELVQSVNFEVPTEVPVGPRGGMRKKALQLDVDSQGSEAFEAGPSTTKGSGQIYPWESSLRIKNFDSALVLDAQDPKGSFKSIRSRDTLRGLPKNISMLKGNVARACSISSSVEQGRSFFKPRPLMTHRNSSSSQTKKFQFQPENRMRNPSLVGGPEAAVEFDQEEFNKITSLVLAKRRELQTEELKEVEEVKTDESATMFAVYSDVYFLYMIGKMCARSGCDLSQGLQALNDYYLLMWHYGDSGSQMDEAFIYSRSEGQKLDSVFSFGNPLSQFGFGAKKAESHSSRVKECIKTLMLIANIYEQLGQPVLAQKYYLKVLEDREALSKYFNCEKHVLKAESRLSRIYLSQISGNTISVLSVNRIQSKKKGAKLESRMGTYQIGSGPVQELAVDKVKIVQDFFY